jgi:hypothetical protein
VITRWQMPCLEWQLILMLCLQSFLCRFKKCSTLIKMTLKQQLCSRNLLSPLLMTKAITLTDGVIRYNNRIWIGQNFALRTKLITAFHSSALGGHSGIQATYQRLKKMLYWAGMKGDVQSFVKQCLVCQQAKHELCKYSGLLQPHPIPQHSWSHISMDFIEGLPNSNGYSVILVIVDIFTKYGHFLPVKHPFSAASIAQLFFDNVVKLHGVPKSIVCDRDNVFTSAFRKELFQLLKTDLKLTSAYHPQSDGKIERVNQCLEIFLRCSVQAAPKQWIKWLSLVEL